MREAATAAVAEAGFDTEDADIADQILDAAHHAMDLPHDALYGKPDTAPVTRRSPSDVTPRVRIERAADAARSAGAELTGAFGGAHLARKH